MEQKISELTNKLKKADLGSAAAIKEELDSMKSDLETLLAKAADLSDRELKSARDQIVEKFGDMQDRAKQVANQASDQIHHGVDMTSDYVKDKPLQSVALAAGIGLLIGAILGRRS